MTSYTSRIGTSPPNSPTRGELPLKKRQKISHESQDVDARIQAALQPLLDQIGELKQQVRQLSERPTPQRVCEGLAIVNGPKAPEIEIHIMKGDKRLVTYWADLAKLKANSTFFASKLEGSESTRLQIDLDQLNIDEDELIWVMHSIRHCFEEAFRDSVFFRQNPELDLDRKLKFSLLFGLNIQKQHAISTLKAKSLNIPGNYELVKTLAEKHKVTELLSHLVNHRVDQFINELNTNNGVIKNPSETDENLKIVQQYAHLITELAGEIKLQNKDFDANLKNLFRNFDHLQTLIISSPRFIQLRNFIDTSSPITTFILKFKFNKMILNLYLLDFFTNYYQIVIKHGNEDCFVMFTKCLDRVNFKKPYSNYELFLGKLRLKDYRALFEHQSWGQYHIFKSISLWWEPELNDDLLNLPKQVQFLKLILNVVNVSVDKTEEINSFVARFKSQWASVDVIVQYHKTYSLTEKNLDELRWDHSQVPEGLTTLWVHGNQYSENELLAFSQRLASQRPLTELLILNHSKPSETEIFSIRQHPVVLAIDPKDRVMIIHDKGGVGTVVRPLNSIPSSPASSSGTTPGYRYPTLRSVVSALNAARGSTQAQTQRSGGRGQIVNQSSGIPQSPLNQVSGASGSTPPPPVKTGSGQATAGLKRTLHQMNQPTPKATPQAIAPTVSPSPSKQTPSTLPPVGRLISQLAGNAREMNARVETLHQRLDQMAQIVGIPTRPSPGSQPRPSPDEIRRQQEALDRRIPDSPSVSPAPKAKPPGKK